MKRILILIAVLVLLALAYIGITIANDRIAESMERALRDAPLPPQTELVDSQSHAGRIAGNGNGMQYFATILVGSELSKEELQLHYDDAVEDEVYVIEQEAQIIYEYDVWFDAWNPDRKCYRVEMWKESCAGCEESIREAVLNLDIRGH